jgi:TolB-like protein
MLIRLSFITLLQSLNMPRGCHGLEIRISPMIPSHTLMCSQLRLWRLRRESRFVETVARRGYRFLAEVKVGDAAPVRSLEPSAQPRPTAEPPERSDVAGDTTTPKSIKGSPARMVSAFAVLLAIAAIAAWKFYSWIRPSHVIRSLAVLPLESLSSDASQDYFADGMTDELISDLGQISALRVISRTSVMAYKRARKPLPQIARELNVDAVVEGTVLRSGDQVRITAQLIEASSDQHSCSAVLDRIIWPDGQDDDRSRAGSVCLSMVLLWNMHVQQPIHAIYISLRYVDFFRKEMNRCYVWPGLNLSVMSGMAAEDNHAMRCHAQDRGYFRIARRLDKEVKLRRVPAKVILQKFLLGDDPVLPVRSMCAPTLFEKLVGTFRDCFEDDLLMLFVSAFDRDHPLFVTRCGLLLHSVSSLRLHL